LAKDKAAMKKLLELRTPKYENADLVVDTDMMSPSQVADKIIRELKLQ
jgi:shikimate kinase